MRSRVAAGDLGCAVMAIAFIGGLFLLTAVAFAGSIHIEVGPEANPVTYQRTRSISDADLQSRVLPALKWQFARQCPGGICSNSEAMDEWLKVAMEGLTDIVRRYEVEQSRALVTDLPE